jgi:hypothetical protein
VDSVSDSDGGSLLKTVDGIVLTDDKWKDDGSCLYISEYYVEIGATETNWAAGTVVRLTQK